MSQLVDIVNFNADASCLSSKRWLSIIKGGPSSTFCRWLLLYVHNKKRMVLGMTGATISDLIVHNPQAIQIVQQNTDIFQVILRPYTHDISLLRTPHGFRCNLTIGRTVIESAFARWSDYYLPPEFMLTSEQLSYLATLGVKATFINPRRYPTHMASRIPKGPYIVQGVLGSELGCIPVDGELTEVYLRAIQLWDIHEWNERMQTGNGILYLWRDGESSFLIPNGLEREEYWLNECRASRFHLGDEEFRVIPNGEMYRSYPAHSFSPWMKELRMLGYLRRIQGFEERFNDLTGTAKLLWLMTINSDIFSAIEKRSPRVMLRTSPVNEKTQEYRILRSERCFEGEDYLALLEKCVFHGAILSEEIISTSPHWVKINNRIRHLKTFELTWNT